MKKKMFAFQIALLIVFSVSSGYIFLGTDTYEHVQSTIVSVLCLSCIKLEPKAVLNFSFETANNQPFPDFVLENLSRGPVLLHYRTDACVACDRMDPMVASLFHLSSLDEDFLVTVSEFNGINVTLIHINLDHASEQFRKSYDIYNILGDNGGVPMFVMITLKYDGIGVRPAYATGYGFLGESTPEGGKQILKKLIEESIAMYVQNYMGWDAKG